MHRPLRPLRARPLLAAAALLGSTLTAAPAAQAGPVFVDAVLKGTSSLYVSDPSHCSATGDAQFGDEDLVDGVTQDFDRAGSWTVSNADNEADTVDVSMREWGSARVSSARGELDEADFRSRSSATIQRSLTESSGCYFHANGWDRTIIDFHVSNRGWMTLELSGQGSTYAEALVESRDEDFDRAAPKRRSDDTFRRLYLQGEGLPYSSETTGLLEPGRYLLYLESQLIVPVWMPGQTVTARGSMVAHAEFHAVGSAIAKAKGPGGAFLKLPAERTCESRELSAGFTKKAKNVLKATVSATGAKSVTVRKPGRGKTVVLRKLPSTKQVTVKAVLTLKNGGGKVAVSRRYRACS